MGILGTFTFGILGTTTFGILGTFTFASIIPSCSFTFASIIPSCSFPFLRVIPTLFSFLLKIFYFTFSYRLGRSIFTPWGHYMTVTSSKLTSSHTIVNADSFYRMSRTESMLSLRCFNAEILKFRLLCLVIDDTLHSCRHRQD